MKMILLILVIFVSSQLAQSSEKSLYDFSWLDKDKEIYVLQNRKFRKVDSIYIGGTASYNLSQAFITSFGGTLRGGYFFTEDWGVELIYGHNSNSENDTAKGVREQGTVPFYRQIDNYVGGMIAWSPFYSKINTFNQIFYYDWIFGLGLGNIQTKDNRNKFDTSSPDVNVLTSESNLGALWNIGIKVYLDKSWSLRVDVTGQTYQADKIKRVGEDSSTPTSKAKKLYSNYDLSLGLNYAF